MLKKKERLTKAMFDRSFSLGRRTHSPTLQLIVDPTKDFHGAVVVGKKVFKSAVKRNRLRRQLYAVLYRERRAGRLPVATYIVIAKPAIKAVADKARPAELAALLQRY